jgi:polysaccharide deacetylase 2 family uncharacterized protein YibQ
MVILLALLAAPLFIRFSPSSTPVLQATAPAPRDGPERPLATDPPPPPVRAQAAPAPPAPVGPEPVQQASTPDEPQPALIAPEPEPELPSAPPVELRAPDPDGSSLEIGAPPPAPEPLPAETEARAAGPASLPAQVAAAPEPEPVIVDPPVQLGPSEQPAPSESGDVLAVPTADDPGDLIALARPTLPPVTSSAPDRLARASVAIIIDDMGPAHAASARAAGLPGPLTLSFLPYADGLPTLTQQARLRGHEIFLHMPMEPLGSENPGPNALLVGMNQGMLRDRLEWALGRVPGATGMNNHMGSRLTSDATSMPVIMDVLREQQLAFVDSRTASESVAAAAAAEAGLPHTSRDVFIDHQPTDAFVRHQLRQIETLARQRGTVVAIGHPLPVTLSALESWIPAAKARGIEFVTASSMIELRGCDGATPAGRCGLLVAAARRLPD